MINYVQQPICALRPVCGAKSTWSGHAPYGSIFMLSRYYTNYYLTTTLHEFI